MHVHAASVLNIGIEAIFGEYLCTGTFVSVCSNEGAYNTHIGYQKITEE